jgi:hypothetical protein
VVLAILRALAAVVRRDLAGYSLIRANNFFLFVALLIWGALVSGVAPVSSYPFLLLLAVLLFFPISSDPLEKIPKVRMGLWPIAGRDRIALRIAALALSPVLWFVVVAVVHYGQGVVLPLGAVVAAAVVRAQAPRSAPGFTIGRVVPAIPGGFGVLVVNYLRAMLAVLDTWLALIIAIIATAWRILARDADPAAWRMLSILAGIALSTQAQCGADFAAARYRLLPLGPRQIILARDGAYIAVQLAFTLALDPIAGLTFGMTALTVGRYPSLYARLRAERWRFSSGRVLFGASQMIAGATLAFAGAAGTAIAVAIWAGSVWWGGSVLAQRFRGMDAGSAPRG